MRCCQTDPPHATWDAVAGRWSHRNTAGRTRRPHSSTNTSSLPQTQSKWVEASRPAVDKGARAARFVFLTPLMGGADGISEMTRQWVRVVESHVGRDAQRVEVWSLDDQTRPPRIGAASTFRTARGGRLRFGSFALTDGLLPAADTIVVVMHLQLLPVALPLIWRGARLVTVLMGIEAWTPLSPLQK